MRQTVAAKKFCFSLRGNAAQRNEKWVVLSTKYFSRKGAKAQRKAFQKRASALCLCVLCARHLSLTEPTDDREALAVSDWRNFVHRVTTLSSAAGIEYRGSRLADGPAQTNDEIGRARV